MTSDRAILASASILQMRVQDATEINGALLQECRATLGCLGATPVDRSRIHWSSAEEDYNPWAVFDRPVVDRGPVIEMGRFRRSPDGGLFTPSLTQGDLRLTFFRQDES